MMRHSYIVSAVVCGVIGAWLAACDGAPTKESPVVKNPTPPTKPSTPSGEVTLKGTLRSGFAAIGGEATGWALERPEAEGGLIEVDVSAPTAAKNAESFIDRRCAITGTIVEREYVERGKVPVLVAVYVFSDDEQTPQ